MKPNLKPDFIRLEGLRKTRKNLLECLSFGPKIKPYKQETRVVPRPRTTFGSYIKYNSN